MTKWHLLDGNMIAADRYYNQPDKWDFTECALCGELFEEEGGEVKQSDKHWSRCYICEDE